MSMNEVSLQGLDAVQMETDPSKLYQLAKSWESSDPKAAIVWYQQAIKYASMAAEGSSEAKAGIVAKVLYGKFLFHGRKDVDPDKEEAVRLFQRASDQGDGDAMAELGNAYFFGYGGLSVDQERAKKLWEEAIKRGSAQAKALLGGSLLGVEPRADQLLQEAQESGNAAAKDILGRLHEEGVHGFAKDRNLSRKWFNEAADLGLGEPEAMWALGRIAVDEGHSEQGKCWFRRGAEFNDEDSLICLSRALLPREGGIPIQKEDAMEGFQALMKALRLGSETARLDIRKLYTLGIGCQKDPREAARWARYGGCPVKDVT
jgi:uncharacterized protein